MNLLAYRNLTDLGFSEDEVSAIAAQYRVTDGPDDTGEMFERPGRASDRFVDPFANEQAARAANNGALPPDLSVITKARGGGPDYIYGLLTGYEEPPPGVELMAGMHYNEYFPGHQIAMPNMLSPGLVQYADGTEATVEQMSWDVTQFLTWAAEPHMESRKEMGVQVILFLIVFTGLMYAVKRKLWADVH
jgi:ubiquinol-cytochrome c reductase cytochrome c1 subunit